MSASLAQIRAKAREIGERFSPAKVILFGSHAYGKPHADSDVDLMVLLTGPRINARGLKIRQSVEFGFPVDLLVRSPSQFARRIQLGDQFLEEIATKGKVLYEAPHPRVDRQSRSRARPPRAKVSKL